MASKPKAAPAGNPERKAVSAEVGQILPTSKVFIEDRNGIPVLITETRLDVIVEAGGKTFSSTEKVDPRTGRVIPGKTIARIHDLVGRIGADRSGHAFLTESVDDQRIGVKLDVVLEGERPEKAALPARFGSLKVSSW